MHFPRNKIASYLKHMRRLHPERCVQSERLIENVKSNDIFDTIPGHLQGLNAFINPAKKVVIRYSSGSGGCQGTREFLEKVFPSLAKNNPSVEFVIDPYLKPIVASMDVYYYNDRKVKFPLRKFKLEEVKQQVTDALGQQGRIRKKFHETVHSLMPAVRPIWSPFHEPSLADNRFFKRRLPVYGTYPLNLTKEDFLKQHPMGKRSEKKKDTF